MFKRWIGRSKSFFCAPEIRAGARWPRAGPESSRAAKVVHVGFDDPPKLAKSAKSEEEALDCYRRVRDEIKKFITKDIDRITGFSG